MAGRLRDWFQEGLYSAIPAATAVDEGALYYATDTDILYRSDGATWTAISSAASQIATHEADTSSAHTAEGIDIVDSGALYTATNVEAALAEVAGDLGALELNDLADVAAGAPSDQDLLTWDDYLGAWVPQAGSVVAALDDLTDVDTYGVTDGQALVYDDYLGEWVPGTVAAGSVALDDLTDVDTYGVTDGEVLTYDDYLGEWVPAASAGGAGPPFPTKLGVVLDAPAASDQVDIIVPFDCTITGVTLLADQSGDIVVDIWKDSYGNHPPTDADSITASAPPTLSTAAKSQDTTLTGWTTSLTSGDVLRFNVDSAATVTRVTLMLDVEADTPGDIATGTTFPTSPTTGQRYRRSDLDYEVYFYDGTRWLSEAIYSIVLAPADVAPQNTTNTGGFLRGHVPWDVSSIYAMKWRGLLYVNTTNDGSNYVTVALRSMTSYSTIASVDSSADSPSSVIPINEDLDTVLTVGIGNVEGLDCLVTPTGSPGNVRLTGEVTYRKVAT